MKLTAILKRKPQTYNKPTLWNLVAERKVLRLPFALMALLASGHFLDLCVLLSAFQDMDMDDHGYYSNR